MARKKSTTTTREVDLLRSGIERFFNSTLDDQHRVVCNCKFGVYAFYDYDGEPIYVGQTRESLRQRIGRHLTNQRTDAVAMRVLDPFEVLEIEVWPFFDLEQTWKSKSKEEKRKKDPKIQAAMDAAESAVYHKLLAASKFKAVLNEKGMVPQPPINLPQSFRGCIIPDELLQWRKEPDVRIARRAATIARLSQVISEREVSHGLRKTLLTQAKRLQWLAQKRFDDLGGEAKVEVKAPGEDSED